MSAGTQISDMTDCLTVFPDGAFVPMIVETDTSGLVTTTNYRYNAGLYLAKLSTLAANGGAALIGTSGSITVQAALDARPTSATLAASGGSALVGFIQAGTGAVATTVQTEIRLDGLRPEQFGAVGDGTTDDSAALQAAYVQQQATGIPITFTPGATYGIGSNGWVGLNWTLARDFELYGNGATLKVLFAASQSAIVGAVNPAIKVDGTAAKFKFILRGMNGNHNLIKEPIFALDRCTFDIADGCYPYGGDLGSGGIGDGSIFIYHTRSTGRYCDNNSKNCPFTLYGGHTDAGYHSDNVVVSDNRGTEFHVSGSSTYRGDPVNGVMHGANVSGNIWSNFFSIGFSGVAANSTVSYNIEVHGNILTDFSGAGVQTDIIGTIASTGFNIHDNCINDASGAALPLYFPQLEDSVISNNQGANCRDAILIDKTGGGVIIDDNNFKLGTSTPAGVGISAVGALGTITKVSIRNNRMKDFATGIGIGGAGNAVSKIDITDNTTDGGARGLYLQDTCTGIFVDGNNFDGAHSTYDIDNILTNGQLGVQFGQNKFATANGVVQILFVAAPSPTAKNADATLTIAELLTRIITTTNSAAVALTLPTGTLTAGGTGTMAIGQAFEWSHINLGSASGAMTLTAGVDHTIVGNPVVAISTQARFETRKTAATTFVTYRIS